MSSSTASVEAKLDRRPDAQPIAFGEALPLHLAPTDEGAVARIQILEPQRAAHLHDAGVLAADAGVIDADGALARAADGGFVAGQRVDGPGARTGDQRERGAVPQLGAAGGQAGFGGGRSRNGRDFILVLFLEGAWPTPVGGRTHVVH
jgi:hypothetical protein